MPRIDRPSTERSNYPDPRHLLGLVELAILCVSARWRPFVLDILLTWAHSRWSSFWWYRCYCNSCFRKRKGAEIYICISISHRYQVREMSADCLLGNKASDFVKVSTLKILTSKLRDGRHDYSQWYRNGLGYGMRVAVWKAVDRMWLVALLEAGMCRKGCIGYVRHQTRL
jgi:hypothetical protein